MYLYRINAKVRTAATFCASTASLNIHTTRVSVSIEGGSFQHFMEGSVVVFTWKVLITLAVDALIPYSFRFKIALTIAL